MKTIKEFTKESVNKIKGIESKGIAYYSIKAGIEFAQRWIPIEEELPPVDTYVLLKAIYCDIPHYMLFFITKDSTLENLQNSYHIKYWRLIELE